MGILDKSVDSSTFFAAFFSFFDALDEDGVSSSSLRHRFLDVLSSGLAVMFTLHAQLLYTEIHTNKLLSDDM